jgi:hypothetical protein
MKIIFKISHHVNCILFFLDFFLLQKILVFSKVHIMLKRMYFMLNLYTHVQNNDIQMGFLKMERIAWNQ